VLPSSEFLVAAVRASGIFITRVLIKESLASSDITLSGRVFSLKANVLSLSSSFSALS
jgi:hypothetical protein